MTTPFEHDQRPRGYGEYAPPSETQAQVAAAKRLSETSLEDIPVLDSQPQPHHRSLKRRKTGGRLSSMRLRRNRSEAQVNLQDSNLQQFSDAPVNQGEPEPEPEKHAEKAGNTIVLHVEGAAASFPPYFIIN